MKQIKTIAAAAIVVAITGCNKVAEQPQELKLETQEQRISYLAATDFANGFKEQGFSLDADAIALAVKDVMAGKDLRMTEEEIKTAMEIWTKDMEELMAKQKAEMSEEMAKKAEENAAIGSAYRMANSEKEGVVSLENGLQYKILVEGTGPKPEAGNVVEVNYRGTLVDGTEFDSSYKRGETAKFGVSQVIPGWTEILMMMPEGSKWQVTIPSDLAYGPGGAGELIGPNATLVFDIELIDASVASVAEE